MKITRVFAAWLMAFSLLFTVLPALAETTGEAEPLPAGSTQVTEEVVEDLSVEDAPAEETPAEDPPAEEQPAQPAFAELPLTKKEDMPKPDAEAKATGIVILPEGIALFELPAHESAILENLSGASVLTLDILGQTWSKVTFGTETGYVPTYALSFAFGTAQPNLALVTAPGGKLTLRAEMTTKSKALGTIPSGRAVLLLAKGETFSLVRHGDKEGYVLTEFLKEVPAGTALGTYTQVVSITPEREANVRLRAQAKKVAVVYFTVKSGNSLVVLGIEEGWAQVEYEGFHGFMMAEYLKKFD